MDVGLVPDMHLLITPWSIRDVIDRAGQDGTTCSDFLAYWNTQPSDDEMHILVMGTMALLQNS